MKTIPAALATHYALKGRTVALFMKVTRSDALVYGWNSTDEPLTVSALVYQPGLDQTSIAFAAGLGVNNLELTILPDPDGGTITRADLLTGVWDNARFELFEANHRSLADGVNVLMQGMTGEVSVNVGSFVVEMRSLSQVLQQPIGIVTAKGCRARLGDTACKVVMGPFTYTGSLTGVTSRQVVTSSARGEAADWFGEGTYTATSGLNGVPFRFKRRITAFAAGQFTFDIPFPYAFSVGDTYSVKAGCRKRHERTLALPAGVSDCIDKFNNVLNFQGEPFARGVDVITASPESNV